jgi:hypothetical protein
MVLSRTINPIHGHKSVSVPGCKNLSYWVNGMRTYAATYSSVCNLYGYLPKLWATNCNPGVLDVQFRTNLWGNDSMLHGGNSGGRQNMESISCMERLAQSMDFVRVGLRNYRCSIRSHSGVERGLLARYNKGESNEPKRLAA